MSLGLHRLWKRALLALAAPRPDETWLDLACGSGDLTGLFTAPGKAKRVIAADPNAAMLAIARQRCSPSAQVAFVRCMAEDLPFPTGQFDGLVCAFGLRNFTDVDAALSELYRVLKPGGRLFILEFAQPWAPLAGMHRRYVLEALPALGKALADDTASYRYLGESILTHLRQDELAARLRAAAFAQVNWLNLTGGITAIHSGWRLL